MEEIDRLRRRRPWPKARRSPKPPPHGDRRRQEKFDLLRPWVEALDMLAVYAIVVLSIVAMTFALERFLGLRRSRVAPTDLLAGVRAPGRPQGRPGPPPGPASGQAVSRRPGP